LHFTLFTIVCRLSNAEIVMRPENDAAPIRPAQPTDSESPERRWAPPKIRRLATSSADISATPNVDGPETTS
jgi:hypothetical protein